ncbi:protein-export chaperone SecB [Buchnera aphidicola]|uniref:protein-export chaperone SecB n=1 Tax=Buchnera aphidicola TaxID=9 RepID=UPI003463F37E
MSEEKQKEKKSEIQFQIQKIYTKNVSFKSPNSPYIFKEQWSPNISCDLNNICSKLEDHVFHVILKVSVKVTLQSKLIFKCKVHQSGIFYIQGMPEEELTRCLGAYCPNILFPYARECISNLTVKSGFPQLNLEPVNFDVALKKSKNIENSK